MFVDRILCSDVIEEAQLSNLNKIWSDASDFVENNLEQRSLESPKETTVVDKEFCTETDKEFSAEIGKEKSSLLTDTHLAQKIPKLDRLTMGLFEVGHRLQKTNTTLWPSFLAHLPSLDKSLKTKFAVLLEEKILALEADLCVAECVLVFYHSNLISERFLTDFLHRQENGLSYF